MKLYIGNKNYSSWSMRPWVLMREFDIPFDEVMLRFDAFDANSGFKRRVAAVSPAGRVPVLVDDAGTSIWDTLAIAETLAERFPAKALWPRDAAARARARSIACEMHSGFGALRNAFPQNIEASLPQVGVEQLAKDAAAAADLARIDAMWADALGRSGGPFLFGAYSIADAMYAPVAGRIRTYALPVGEAASGYVERIWATKGVCAWVAQALEEHDFVAFDEPHRRSRDG
jgi:glutathione S-transferase